MSAPQLYTEYLRWRRRRRRRGHTIYFIKWNSFTRWRRRWWWWRQRNINIYGFYMCTIWRAVAQISIIYLLNAAIFAYRIASANTLLYCRRFSSAISIQVNSIMLAHEIVSPKGAFIGQTKSLLCHWYCCCCCCCAHLKVVMALAADRQRDGAKCDSSDRLLVQCLIERRRKKCMHSVCFLMMTRAWFSQLAKIDDKSDLRLCVYALGAVQRMPIS